MLALESAASQPDNVRKLSIGQARDRHMFVYIDEDNYLPWKDLEYGQLPRHAPHLGAPITSGWLATTYADRVLCWLYTSHEGWAPYMFDRTLVFP